VLLHIASATTSQQRICIAITLITSMKDSRLS
jgi:hypothetical protein